MAMNRIMKLNLIVMLMAGVTGCASMQSVPSKMKSFVFRSKPAEDDPLVADGKVSDSYKAAKRELKNADVTTLKFADWCEQRGDFLEAKKRYQDVLNDNPQNVNARLGIARVEYATGRTERAETILEAAAKKHPDNAQVWLQMGRIQTASEQYGAATQSLLKAASLAPSDQETRYELGLAMARSERHTEALEHLTSAVGESAALYNIGFVLSESKRTEEAKHWFSRALASHPNERTRSMTTRMLAELGAERNPMALPKIVASASPKSRVLVEQTNYEAYRETPSNWKTEVNTAGHSEPVPVIKADTDIQAQTPQSVTHAGYSPNASNANTGVPMNGATTPMWRGPGQRAAAIQDSNVGNMPNQTVTPPLWGSR